MNNEFKSKDLTSEKRLWDIYLLSRRIKSSRFNVYSTWFVFVLLMLNVLLSESPLSETALFVREMASSTFSITLTTMGFLLSGFTIFATVTQPDLFIAMGNFKNEKSGLSQLKHNYFIFLRVFIYYIAFAVFAFFIMIFGHDDGLVETLVRLSPYEMCIKFFVVKISYAILLSGMYFLIMQLKSFVFNIYHAIMSSLRWHMGPD